LHALIKPFAQANSFQGYKSFVIDLVLYALGMAGVLLFAPLAAKIVGGIVAGLALVNLGSLSHEAAHRSVVRSQLGNKIIAVVSFTMILFNYRLWVYEHHVMHHGRTNVKLNNFLSPLTLEEYRSMSGFRRALYRTYHSPTGLGILLYFLVERWPTVHFVAGKWLPRRHRASAWRYTALLAGFMTALFATLVLVPSARGESVAVALLCGFVLPYVVWFMVFSMTAYLQHTNPQLRWYESVGSMASPPESTAVHVGIHPLINHVTHYVLEHSVHHISAMIPHYRLREAQAVLAGNVEQHIITMPFNYRTMADVLRRCRLYDFQNHAWMNLAGEVTAVPLDTSGFGAPQAGRSSDEQLPDDAVPNSPSVFFPGQEAVEVPEPAVTSGRQEA
jgi:omega-6 fatty acid desaturase (delta-12 desaturase)